MNVRGAVIVVTGGASGIGRALADRFLADGASRVVIADVARQVDEVAAEIGAIGRHLDVSDETAVHALVDEVETTIGPIDLWCANAGIGTAGGVEVPDEEWQRCWEINVMAHLYSARALIPRMAARGGGHLLHTVSAAGLLTNPGAMPYAVTKHAAVAVAEYLAIHYADQGIRVSCLCPQGVDTPMVREGWGQLAIDTVVAQGLLEPEAVAEAVMEGLAVDRFLILPHPEVRDFELRRADDHDRWIAGMRRLVEGLTSGS